MTEIEAGLVPVDAEAGAIPAGGASSPSLHSPSNSPVVRTIAATGPFAGVLMEQITTTRTRFSRMARSARV
jgi:hypothetical protein